LSWPGRASARPAARGALLLSSCAAGPSPVTGSAGPAGDWLGLWQGFICPFAFLASLFNENVGIYEVNNNGGWYDFGFVIGVSVIFGGPGGAGGRASRRRSVTSCTRSSSWCGSPGNGRGGSPMVVVDRRGPTSEPARVSA